MDPGFQLLSNPTAASSEGSSSDSQPPKSPKYLNGHRLPINRRKKLTRDKLGIPLQEIDPYYKNAKTFVVIGPGTQIVHRYDVGDSTFTTSGGWRSQAISIVSHGVFNYAMIFVVLLNCILMAAYPLKIETQSNNTELLVHLAEVAFLVIYVLEALLKILARGLYKFHGKFSYLNIIWSWLDQLIIVTGILMTIRIPSNLLYSCVGFRVLKLIPLHPGLLTVWDNVICKIVNKLRPVLYYMIVMMYLLGLLGIQLYMGVM